MLVEVQKLLLDLLECKVTGKPQLQNNDGSNRESVRGLKVRSRTCYKNESVD